MQCAALSAIFLDALDGPARELVANWIAEYLKHQQPEYFSQRSRKNKAYVPPALVGEEMWHGQEIQFENVALLRAPLSEEKTHLGMQQMRLYRENPLINLELNYKDQQQLLLATELFFADAGKVLKPKVQEAGRDYVKSASRYVALAKALENYQEK